MKDEVGKPVIYFQAAETVEYVAPDEMSKVTIRKATGADDLERDVLIAQLAKEAGGTLLTPGLARELLWHEARLTFSSWTFVDEGGQVPEFTRARFESLPEDILIDWQAKIWELMPHWGPERVTKEGEVPPSNAGERS